MKALSYTQKSIFVALFSVLLLFFSCSELFDAAPDDPCDQTVKPEKQVSIKVTVTLFAKNNQPLPNEPLGFTIHKKPCGENLKGVFDFGGQTNEQGIKTSTIVNYNLRNADDLVHIYVSPNNQTGFAEYDYHVEGLVIINTYNIDIDYKYDDFISGSTKEVFIYAYRNF